MLTIMKNRAARIWVAIALAFAAVFTIGAVQAVTTQDEASAFWDSTLSNSGSLPVYMSFDTGYTTWIQPGWQFGYLNGQGGVQDFRLFGQQCAKYVYDGSGGWKYVCNYSAWDPNNQTYITVQVPHGLTFVQRYL